MVVTDRSGQPVLDQYGKHMMVDAVDNYTRERKGLVSGAHAQRRIATTENIKFFIRFITS